MKKLKKTVVTLALAAAISSGVIWGAIAGHSNHTTVASDPVYIQKPGHVAMIGMIGTTPEIVASASAAQQLDAATSSGGPTAAMNQKIQEQV